MKCNLTDTQNTHTQPRFNCNLNSFDFILKTLGEILDFLKRDGSHTRRKLLRDLKVTK